MIYPEFFEEDDDYDYYSEGEDYSLYEEEDYDYDLDDWHIPVLNHEMCLYQYSPEDVEDVTIFDLLKVSAMTTKLVDSVNLRKEAAGADEVEAGAEVGSEAEAAYRVEKLLGGEENMNELERRSKDIKKFAMKSLRTSLAKWLPVLAVEEDILDNILGHMNLLDMEQDVGQDWKFAESTEEEKVVIDSLYSCLSDIYRRMREDLFGFRDFVAVDSYHLSQDLIEQLQGIVAQIFEADKEIDDCGEREDEDKKAEERIDDGAAQGSKKEDEGELIPGKVAQLVIKVTNPSTTGTVITPKKMEELKASETEKEEEKPVVSAINPLRQPSIVKCEHQSAGLVTADVKLSTSQIYVPDEAAEIDDHGVDPDTEDEVKINE